MVALPSVAAAPGRVVPLQSVITTLSALSVMLDGALPNFSRTVAMSPLPGAMASIDMEYTKMFSLPSFTPAVTLCLLVLSVVMAEFSTSSSRESIGIETCTDDTLSLLVSPTRSSTMSPGLPSTDPISTILSAAACAATDNIMIHTSRRCLMMLFFIINKLNESHYEDRLFHHLLAVNDVNAGRQFLEVAAAS